MIFRIRKNVLEWIINFLMIVSTGYIWWLVYEAQYLAYDANFGNFIRAFILTILFTIITAVVLLRFKPAYRFSSIIYRLSLLLNNPLTLLLVCVNYSYIFNELAR